MAEGTATSSAQATSQAAEAQAVTSQESVATEAKVTGRQRLIDRYSKSHPDVKFEGDNADDDFFGFIADDLDKRDKDSEKNKSLIKQLNDTFGKFPQSAEMFSAMAKNGVHPVDFIIDNYSDDLENALKSEENKAKLKKKRLEREEAEKKRQQEDDDYDNNFRASLDVIHKFGRDHGMNEEQLDGHYQKIRSAMMDVASGKYSPEILQLFLDGGNYKKDVALAREEGVIDGRNAKIKAELQKSASNRTRVPSGSGRSIEGLEYDPTPSKGRMSMFGIPVKKEQ